MTKKEMNEGAERLLKDMQRSWDHPCPTCQQPSDMSKPFCAKCGTRNPHFCFEDFIHEQGFASVELAQQLLCAQDHQEIIDEHSKYVEQSEGLTNSIQAQYPFCPLCGRNVIKLGTN